MGKQVRIVENPVFNDLRTAVPENVDGEGVQGVGVAQNQAGLAESAGQILSGRQVNGGFATHRGIHRRQQGGGHLNKADAPKVAGSRESGQVTGDTAAQSDDDIGPGQSALRQEIQKLQKNRAVFAFLTGGKHETDHGESGLFQTVHCRYSIERKDGSFADHADFRCPAQLFYLFAQLRQQTAPDENVIGFGRADSYGIHPSTSSFRFLPSSSSRTRASISLSRMACWYSFRLSM